MTLQFAHMTSTPFFGIVLFLLSSLVKFHVNIITSSGVMTIFFSKGLTRNPEIGNTPSEFCLISGDRGKLEKPNLARMLAKSEIGLCASSNPARGVLLIYDGENI